MCVDVFDQVLFDKLVYKLNSYQMRNGDPKRIVNHILWEYSMEAIALLKEGYKLNKTANMGDSVLVAISMLC